MSPEEILTMVTFNKDPAIVWQWHYDFLKLMKACKPNEGHWAIKDFIQFSKEKSGKLETMLVT